MSSFQVHRTKDSYKILTMYRLESWLHILSEPIFILPLDIEKEEITNKFFEALNNSRNLSESEEESFRLDNKLLLKRMKESSFNKLYMSSSACDVSLKQDEIIITPLKCLGKNQGLDEDEENLVKVLYTGKNKDEVSFEIINILESRFKML